MINTYSILGFKEELTKEASILQKGKALAEKGIDLVSGERVRKLTQVAKDKASQGGATADGLRAANRAKENVDKAVKQTRNARIGVGVAGTGVAGVATHNAIQNQKDRNWVRSERKKEAAVAPKIIASLKKYTGNLSGSRVKALQTKRNTLAGTAKGKQTSLGKKQLKKQDEIIAKAEGLRDTTRAATGMALGAGAGATLLSQI